MLLNDVLRVALLPSAIVLMVALIMTTLIFYGFSEPMSAVLAVVLAETALVILAIVVKRLLVGPRWGRDHQTPFWSLRHFVYFFAQDCFMSWCAGPFGILEGTLMSNPLLRRFGCRIGRHALINTPMQAFDWNAVDIGENCVVEGILQLHSFENGRLKGAQRKAVREAVEKLGCSVVLTAQQDLILCDAPDAASIEAILDAHGTPRPETVGVARATAVTGPYEKYGENPILHSNTGDVGFDGPGHCSVIESPDDPQEWIIFYHSYVRPATSGARALMMDTLTFDAAAGGRPGGWPRLSTGTKSPSTAPTPLPPTTARQAAPAPWRYHGVVFGGGEWSSADAPLGSAASDSSLRAAIASGASAIRLIPTCEPSHRVLYLGVEGRGRARGRRRA